MMTARADWLMPSLCVGDVMHARTRPTRNVFHYPIFYLRLPLSRLGTLDIRGLAINRRGLCQILNQDHGPQDGSDLLGWARKLLDAHDLAEATRHSSKETTRCDAIQALQRPKHLRMAQTQEIDVV